MADAETDEPIDSKTKLMADCKDIWAEINFLQEMIDSSSENTVVAVEDGNTAQLVINHGLSEQLKAQIDTQKYLDFNILSNNEEYLLKTAEGELYRFIEEMKQLKSMNEVQIKELKGNIEKKNEIYSEFEQIKESLQKKIEEQKKAVVISDASYTKEINEKVEKAKTFHRTLIKKMAKFISENIQSPSREEYEKWKQKHDQSGEIVDLTEIKPLADIIQELMNLCLMTPHDPYIVTDDTYWPPYIEMLHRFNIVTKHPQFDNRIKLTPFHL